MFSKIIKRLAGRIARPAVPQYGDWRVDPRHPANAGWERSDIERGARPVRFHFGIGDAPKIMPPTAATTGFGFATVGGDHKDSHADPSKPVAGQVPPRTGISHVPRADSTFWTRGQ